MKKLLPLLLLLSVVFVAGCGGREGVDRESRDGLSITSFIADPAEVEGGETVYFIMDIENVGGAIAENIEAELIGLPDQWDWESEKKQHIDGLYPPEEGIEGEAAFVEWKVKSPVSDTTITYPAEALVKYHYTTHSESLVRVATREWIRSLPQDQQKTEMDKLGQVKKSPEKGPIHTNIKVRSGTVYAGADFRMILDIQNVGSGRPIDDIVTIIPEGVSCDESGSVELIKGKSKQIRCTASLGGVDTWKNIKVDIDLYYDYVIRSATNVKVLGKPVE